VAYLQQLAVDSPLVSVSTVATTYENRSMVMATISTGSNPNKPVIVFDCAVHAREWAAPSTCLWFINEVSISQSITFLNFVLFLLCFLCLFVIVSH